MKKSVDTDKTLIFHSRETTGLRRHTVVGVIVNNDLRIGYAIASEGEQFTKELGRTIAHGRAIKKPKEVLTIGGKSESEINSTFRAFAKSLPTMFKDKIEIGYHARMQAERNKKHKF